jgi:hypothetical protein
MKCPQCGRDNPPGSNFCLDCARLAVACASCGADLPAGSRFCNKCGNRVGAPSAGHARFQSPEAYTPKHLAEKILTSKTALEGERKQVTVLFADMKGSMGCWLTVIPKKRARFSTSKVNAMNAGIQLARQTAVHALKAEAAGAVRLHRRPGVSRHEDPSRWRGVNHRGYLCRRQRCSNL